MSADRPAALVGRDATLLRLTELVERTAGGLSAAAVLTGPSGSGRTTILELVAARARRSGLHVIALRGSSGRPEPSGSALADLVGPLMHLAQELGPGHQLLLRRLTGGHGVAASALLRAATAVHALLGRAAERRPLALLVDDADRLDRASLDVLHLIGRRLLAEPALLVLASPAEAPAEFERIALEPLADDDAVALLAGLRPDLAPGVARRIVRAAAGQPRELRAISGDLGEAQAHGRAPLPLRPVSAHRVAALRALLAEASPAERTLWTTLAASVPGPRDAEALVSWVLRDGAGADPGLRPGLLVHDDDGPRFACPLDAHAVHAACTPTERLLAHRRLAAIYRDQRARLWQQAQAAPRGAESLAVALELAAVGALGDGALADAELLAARALELTTPDRPRRRRARLHARCLDAVGRPLDALAVLDLAGDRDGDGRGVRELRARGTIRAADPVVGARRLAPLAEARRTPRGARIERELRVADALAGLPVPPGPETGPAEALAAATHAAAEQETAARALLSGAGPAVPLERDAPIELVAQATRSRLDGDLQAAREQLVAAEAASADQPVLAAHLALLLLEIRTVAGPLPEPEECDALASRLAGHGMTALRWRVLWAHGRIALLAGSCAEAGVVLDDAAAERLASGEPLPAALLLDRAEAAACANQPPPPVAVAEHAGSWAAAHAALVRAESADAVAAAARWFLERPPERAGWRDGAALVHAGTRLRRARRRAAARTVLVHGERLLRARGAWPWADRAVEALATVERRPTAERSGRPEALTPSERCTARLAADGLRNREIAGRLAVAEKTVEQRLTVIYRKLGVRSRVDLRASLDRAGGSAPGQRPAQRP
ncbi:LuxR family transcriptional regulator [Patulibacter defluvii]|uniref:LuxR family transcriptional regulator n=1 Tax=Patulibacter defluvii TaxID=3095358 RepID=UPI002A760796|nr:LuxR family transcriptional regulator [Patulibacter sp. DM4]